MAFGKPQPGPIHGQYVTRAAPQMQQPAYQPPGGSRGNMYPSMLPAPQMPMQQSGIPAVKQQSPPSWWANAFVTRGFDAPAAPQQPAPYQPPAPLPDLSQLIPAPPTREGIRTLGGRPINGYQSSYMEMDDPAAAEQAYLDAGGYVSSYSPGQSGKMSAAARQPFRYTGSSGISLGGDPNQLLAQQRRADSAVGLGYAPPPPRPTAYRPAQAPGFMPSNYRAPARY